MASSSLERALTPPRPGLAVRSLGSVLPGVRRSGDQIREYAAGWRTEVDSALTGDASVLVVFGDSLGQGIGAASRDRGYASLVATELQRRRPAPVSVLNLSRSGARIDDVLATQIPAFDEVMANHDLRIVGGICTVGSNDLVRSARFGRTKRSIDDLVVELPAGVVLATVPDVGSVMAKRFNRHLRARAEATGRPLADVASALTSWRGLVAGDRFHPNDRGHGLWADVIVAAVDSSPGQTPALATSPEPGEVRATRPS